MSPEVQKELDNSPELKDRISVLLEIYKDAAEYVNRKDPKIPAPEEDIEKFRRVFDEQLRIKAEKYESFSSEEKCHYIMQRNKEKESIAERQAIMKTKAAPVVGSERHVIDDQSYHQELQTRYGSERSRQLQEVQRRRMLAIYGENRLYREGDTIGDMRNFFVYGSNEEVVSYFQSVSDFKLLASIRGDFHLLSSLSLVKKNALLERYKKILENYIPNFSSEEEFYREMDCNSWPSESRFLLIKDILEYKEDALKENKATAEVICNELLRDMSPLNTENVLRLCKIVPESLFMDLFLELPRLFQEDMNNIDRDKMLDLIKIGVDRKFPFEIFNLLFSKISHFHDLQYLVKELFKWLSDPKSWLYTEHSDSISTLAICLVKISVQHLTSSEIEQLFEVLYNESYLDQKKEKGYELKSLLINLYFSVQETIDNKYDGFFYIIFNSEDINPAKTALRFLQKMEKRPTVEELKNLKKNPILLLSSRAQEVLDHEIARLQKRR